MQLWGACMADLIDLVFSPSGGHVDIAWPKIPAISHCCHKRFLVSKASGKQRRSFEAGYSKELNLSLKCAGCGQPRPARLILYCTILQGA